MADQDVISLLPLTRIIQLNFDIAIQTDKKESQNIPDNTNLPHQTLNDKITSQQPNNSNANSIKNLIKNAAHPAICLLIIIIKLLAFLSFIMLGIVLNSDTVVYLIVILLGACDFWIMKNIAGRHLVGLRWWNEVKENGEEVWIFESKNEKKESNVDVNVFWICLYVNAAGWLILFVYEVITITPTWSIIAFIMLVFAGMNLYGYFKCSKDQQRKFKTIGSKFAVKAVKKGFKQHMEKEGGNNVNK